MTYNIEDIKGFVHSQIDASVHLSGPLSERAFSIIVQRTIKHFELPKESRIAIIQDDLSTGENYSIHADIPTDQEPEVITALLPKQKSKRVEPSQASVEITSAPDESMTGSGGT